MSILHLKPVFQERIWGGRKLETEFGYTIPEGPIGECWGISAHPAGESVIVGGVYDGKQLSELWNQERSQLFGDYELNEFPLLIKILDARDDLSVQVHPNDEQAGQLEGEPYGKTECWYILDAEPGAEIILGHYADTKEEVAGYIYQGQWEKLLRKMPVKRGDFIFVKSGTIHAIGKGITILETQQSSDTTYRVYDYDRKDAAGNLRELHLEKAIAVTNAPDLTDPLALQKQTVESGETQELISINEFTVAHHAIKGTNYKLATQDHFQLVTVIEGRGTITADGETTSLKKGDHFIITRGTKDITANGEMEWITSYM